MTAETYTAWDIGGAHLKVATVGADGSILAVEQQICQLWKGLEQLTGAMTQMAEKACRVSTRHAITMTGELSDIFPDRHTGVEAIIATVENQLAVESLQVFAGVNGLLDLEQARLQTDKVASANWLATAQYVASCVPDALLVDMGSTTTDIIPLRAGRPQVQAYDDAGRLRTEELVYSGVVRTPLMAISRRVAFDGEWVRLAAEHFATAGDVYRLTGDLHPDEDMETTADGEDKSLQASARRLSRMLGMDLEQATLHQWQALAQSIARQHHYQILQSLERVLSRHAFSDQTPVVGAGAGRFLIRAIAEQLQRPYVDVSSLFECGKQNPEMVAVCAPAVSLACILREAMQ